MRVVQQFYLENLFDGAVLKPGEILVGQKIFMPLHNNPDPITRNVEYLNWRQSGRTNVG